MKPGPSLSQLADDHPSLFLKKFECYFPTTKDPRTAKEWIRDPFVNMPGDITLSVLEEDQLLEITNDGGFKSMFYATPTLLTFRIKIKVEFLEIATKPQKILLQFPMSYLCEGLFSAVTATKMK